MEPNYMCFSQTIGSLGVEVKKANVLIDSVLMTDTAGGVEIQRNSEYWQEKNRDEMYCSVWLVSAKEFLSKKQLRETDIKLG